MKFLINLSTLKAGGGQNVALNFIRSIEETNIKNIHFYYFTAENSTIHAYLKKKHMVFYVVPTNPIKRILFELFKSKAILLENKTDLIYSYFGIGLFIKQIPQISGSADSNIYFPEVDFWTHYKKFSKLKKKIIDMYRIWGIKRADAVIFENKALEVRSHQIFKLENTITIKPSINFNFNNERYSLPAIIDSNTPIGLFLCGWQYNKNIMVIPGLALELKKKKQPFHFLLTAPLDESKKHIEFINLLREKNVEDMVTVTGQISKEELAGLYSQIDFVFLLSKLESFSNNIIESWYFQKPIVVADEIWAQEICKDAAIYVNRDSPLEITNVLLRYINSPKLLQNIFINSALELCNYPSIEERTMMEIDFLKRILFKNKK